MGEASMRKWMRRTRRALVDMWDQRRAQVAKIHGTVRDMRVVLGDAIAVTDNGVVSAGRWPPVYGGTSAMALRMRRAHRRKRVADRFHGLIARVIEGRSAQIAANVRTNHALFGLLRRKGYSRG
jgi:hypothetical protein